MVPPWQGSLLFATLRGTHLHRVTVDENDPRRVTDQEELLEGRYGRLRDVQEGREGQFYVLTSNRDGRGNLDRKDDQILGLWWK